MRRAVAVGLAAFLVGAALRSDRTADAWFADEPARARALGDRVAAAVSADALPWYASGDPRYDGEWTLVTCQMALLGFGQLVAREPGLRARYAAAVDTCATRLIEPTTRSFGTDAWGEDGFVTTDPAAGHAYLGWANLGLGMAARLGNARARPVHDALTALLAARLAVLPVHRFETYPGETYPPDLAAVVGSVGLHGGYASVVGPFVERFRDAAVDPANGLLYQSLSPLDGSVRDGARGSGTLVAAYFLTFADRPFATSLAESARTHLTSAVGPFGGMREVPRGAPARMDIDSGPVLFGLSVAASGFGLASTRLLHDEPGHRVLFRSVHAVGSPLSSGGQQRFLTGGALGDAILFAMLTAGPPP